MTNLSENPSHEDGIEFSLRVDTDLASIGADLAWLRANLTVRSEGEAAIANAMSHLAAAARELSVYRGACRDAVEERNRQGAARIGEYLHRSLFGTDR